MRMVCEQAVNEYAYWIEQKEVPECVVLSSFYGGPTLFRRGHFRVGAGNRFVGCLGPCAFHHHCLLFLRRRRVDLGRILYTSLCAARHCDEGTWRPSRPPTRADRPNLLANMGRIRSCPPRNGGGCRGR